MYSARNSGREMKKPQRYDLIWDHMRKGVAALESGNSTLAEREYTEAAKLGSESGHNSLGALLTNKLEDTSAVERGLRHLRIAASRGYYPAAWNLAVTYGQLGKSRWQLFWMKRAASLGDEEAVAELKKTAENNDGKSTKK